MTVRDLTNEELAEVCFEDGSDFMDGDIEGYAGGYFDTRLGLMVMYYSPPNEDAEFQPAVRHFREVSYEC